MGIKWFLAIAATAFLAATAGSDAIVSMTNGGQSLADALSEHFYWARVEFVGTLALFAPFAFLAAIAWWVENNTGTWKASLLFAAPTIYLIYSYFEGYQASQIAASHKLWTAATVSIGFLPLRAAPVVLIVWLVGVFLVRLHSRERTRQPAD
jgi:hypothetical protein